MYRTLKEALQSISPSDIGKASQEFKVLFKNNNENVERLREEYPIFFILNELREEYIKENKRGKAKMLLSAEQTIRILIDIAEQREYFEK